MEKLCSGTNSKSEGMLTGYRVLDLTDEKGVYCGQLLGSLGAEVIKIEKPGGDRIRNIGPFAGDIPDPERSLFWLAFNTNKKGITLNIETLDGREIFMNLVKDSDMVIESFDPGYMENIGLGYEDLNKINPKIVMVSITPYGQTGPYRDYKATDLECWAMGGLLSGTGDQDHQPPQISHIPAAYLLASQDAAWGGLIALYWRNLSGLGQWVDISIQESIVRTTFVIRESWIANGKELKRSNFGHQIAGGTVTIRKVWKAKDGYIAFMVFGGQFGARQVPQLVEWMKEENMADDFLKEIDWSNLDWGTIPQKEADRIQYCFDRFFSSKTKTQLLDGALKRHIMLQPFSTPKELLDHPHLVAREYWQIVEYPQLGFSAPYPGRCCMPRQSFCGIRLPAPAVGEHNSEIYEKELGLSPIDLTILKQAGII